MVSRCRSTIGKRPANTTCDTFRSIPTDENGASAKVEQSTPNLISCGPCTSGVTRSSRMRSRCDLSENRAAPCQCDCFADGLTPSISFLPTAEMEGTCRAVRDVSYSNLMASASHFRLTPGTRHTGDPCALHLAHRRRH